MAWKKESEETYEELFIRKGYRIEDLPHHYIIDIQAEGGIEEWAKKQSFKSERELRDAIIKIFRITLNDNVLIDKKTRDNFPSLRNFHSFVERMDKGGNLALDASKIAEVVWYDGLAQKRLQERTDKMFANKPDKELYEDAVKKIKDIWGFTDKEIDAFRYFCMQTRHKGHNPSMNKAIYLWAKAKQTGKTTIARTIIAILNGFNSIDEAQECESTLSRELQYGTHDIPKSALYNAVLLDEAMPKDSRKSYGAVKSMLTSSSCSFNPKYQAVRQLTTKRFYLCTSNDDVAEFIQDEKERRFISIKLETTPRQLSFEDIFDIWKQFITNAEPEDNWQDWYNSFALVKGLQSVEVEYYRTLIKTDIELRNILNQFTGTYISIGVFYKHLITGKQSTDEKKAVKQAVVDVFGESPYPSKWASSNIRDKIEEIAKSDNEPNPLALKANLLDAKANQASKKGGDDELPF